MPPPPQHGRRRPRLVISYLVDCDYTIYLNVSRLERATANDSDRLRKYLQRFGLTWADIMEAT